MISRFQTYAFFSFLFTAGVIAYTYYFKFTQYYPAALFLMSSKTSRFAFLNNGIVLLVYFGMFVTKIFLNKLRELEAEVKEH